MERRFWAFDSLPTTPITKASGMEVATFNKNEPDLLWVSYSSETEGSSFVCIHSLDLSSQGVFTLLQILLEFMRSWRPRGSSVSRLCKEPIRTRAEPHIGFSLTAS